MKTNIKTSIHTHEGAKAKKISTEMQLRRSVLSCLLWERSFYESGQTIAERISSLADKCSKEFVSSLAVQARTEYHLRHVPLLLILSLVKKGGNIVGKTIEKVINRPDELTELISLYWTDGKKPLPKQMKLGLANAFNKFDEYQFAKWNRDGDIKIRDVMFLVHPKPEKGKKKLFKRIASNELQVPNTWESRLGSGQDKKEVFTDLLKTKKLGYMALLRNLRGMNECGVDSDLIKKSLLKPSSNVLPFRFLSAAKHAPVFEPQLDKAMSLCMQDMAKLNGKTVLLVDVSGSMFYDNISSKSDLTRADAACALGILLQGICEDVRVFTFSNAIIEVPARGGMALRDAIISSQPHGATYLGQATNEILEHIEHDRLIVITDEQSADRVPDPKNKLSYMINVASNKNGVGYGPWTHIDGFSESCIKFIQGYERENN